MRSVLLASAAIVIFGATAASSAPPVIHVPAVPALPAHFAESGFSYAVWRVEQPRKPDVIEADASLGRYAGGVTLHDPGGGRTA
ncbi:MAG TPA: hypothetical protein VF439_02050 [Candidatus Paceibacterota bacterium]